LAAQDDPLKHPWQATVTTHGQVRPQTAGTLCTDTTVIAANLVGGTETGRAVIVFSP
jgi:hypothetical protein